MTKQTLIILLFTVISHQIYAVTISGTISGADNEKLPGVNVYIQGTYDGATSDSNGYFTFSTAQERSQVLIASFIGYRSFEKVLSLHDDVELKISLKEDINKLTGVTITAGSFEASDEKKSTILKPLDVAMTAGASADIAAALNMLPGTTTNGETGRLFVRGGVAHETQAFIDGALVSNFYSTTPNNVPARGRFDPFLFKGTFFSTGGYSAEYGQALSSVLSLNSLDIAEETITDISLMSVGGGAAHTQKWEHGSVYAKVEYLDLDPYMNLIEQQYDWKDGFTSVNGTFMLRQKVKENDMLKVYANYDRSAFHAIIPSINNPEGDDTKMTNHNTYLNASYKKSVGETGFLYLGGSYGQYTEYIDFNAIDVENANHSIHTKSFYEADISSLSIKIGGEIIHYDEEQKTSVNQGASNVNDYSNSQLASFTEVDYYLTNALTIRAGLRYSYYTVFEKGDLSPRLSMAYQISENGQISAAFGKFHQLPQSDLMLVAQDQLKPEKADHYIASYQRIKEGLTFRAEVYHKQYQDLIKHDESLNPDAYDNSGSGYARGLDLFFRDDKTIKNGDYWISYSFIDSKRNHRDYPASARPEFVSMHNLSIVYKHFIPSARTMLGASWDFNSGRPYHDPNGDGFNDQKTEFYSNVSFNVAYLYKQNIIFYASASNLLGRDNVFGYEFEDDPGSDSRYDARPIGQQAKRFFFVGLFISLTKDKKTNQLDYL